MQNIYITVSQGSSTGTSGGMVRRPSRASRVAQFTDTGPARRVTRTDSRVMSFTGTTVSPAAQNSSSASMQPRVILQTTTVEALQNIRLPLRK